MLVGNPRTGTTFLQRFLSDNGFGAGMELFLMLYPSLIIQKLFRPLLPLLEKISPAKFHASEAHATSLSSVETDDVAVLFRHLDGFFLYGFFLSWDDEDRLSWFDPRVRDTSKRDLAWLDKLWRRSLVLHNADRNIAKVFSFSVRLPQFLANVPGAQILYMARDPLSIIPSAMSLVIGVLDRAVGFWSMPDDLRRRWLDRMYKAWVLLLQKFHEDWTSGAIDKSRVYIVRYDRMMGDFEGVMDEMCRFLGRDDDARPAEDDQRAGREAARLPVRAQVQAREVRLDRGADPARLRLLLRHVPAPARAPRQSREARVVAPRRRRGLRLLFFQVAALPRFARERLVAPR